MTLRRFRVVLIGAMTGLLVVGAAVPFTLARAAAPPTYVSLEFDDALVSQYTLGWQQALAPHAAHATFFVPTLANGGSSSFLSDSQERALLGAGNDFGGKAFGLSLVGNGSGQTEVCENRFYLNGFEPVGFAYPNGAYDASAEAAVKACGYGTARTAGGLSVTGRTYAESIPPTDPYAIRAYAPPTVTLPNLESLVNGAAAHGGGWDQIVIRNVCSESLDPANYRSCAASSGHIELADLNAFLGWVAAAGQAGGAPAGVELRTVGALTTAIDTTTPSTTILCNGLACSTTPYTVPVKVTFPATDSYSGVASTRYTLDGTAPTPDSPAYAVGSEAFSFVQYVDGPTTVMFRSWDRAGNAEPVQTVVVPAPPDTTPPTTALSVVDTTCPCTNARYETINYLTATDVGGAGLAHTYFTTDGSTPTTTSSVYTGPIVFSTPGPYTVKYFSTDNDGNQEAFHTGAGYILPWPTRVTLSFDNGTASQYTLGWQQALQPHHAVATFYVDTAKFSSVPGPYLSWAQVQSLAAAGNAIGGKSDSTNLTTDPNAAGQACADRRLLQYGITPAGFAYPGGAFNTAIENEVAACGWGNARTAGSLSPAGPTFAEDPFQGLPSPTNWLASRAYAPSGQLTLANMQALVTAAAGRGGGWVQIVAGKVCSQALEPPNYTSCRQSAGRIELADLNAFLDWMANVGKLDGAPLGAVLTTVSQAASANDATAPVTTIACNGAPCTGHYSGLVNLTLTATDTRSGVAATRYTIDGTTPTATSPSYLGPVTVPGGATVTYRSWDVAGNAEAPHTQSL